MTVDTLSRKNLKKNPFAAFYCGSMQRALFDDDYADDKEYTAWFDMRDCIGDFRYERSGVFQLPYMTLQEYEDALPSALQSVLQTADCTELIVMPLLAVDWFMQGHESSLVQEAYNELYTITGKKPFYDVLFTDIEGLSKLVVPLFRLARYCASLPQIVMISEEQRTVISLCKYGGLHCDWYDEASASKFMRAIALTNWKEVHEERDFEYSDIDTRRIIT